MNIFEILLLSALVTLCWLLVIGVGVAIWHLVVLGNDLHKEAEDELTATQESEESVRTP